MRPQSFGKELMLTKSEFSSNIIATMSMTVNKISISLPTYIIDYLAAIAGKREVSGFIARAVEEKMLRDTGGDDPVEAFIALRKRLPKVSDHAIRAAVSKGRT